MHLNKWLTRTNNFSILTYRDSKFISLMTLLDKYLHTRLVKTSLLRNDYVVRFRIKFHQLLIVKTDLSSQPSAELQSKLSLRKTIESFLAILLSSQYDAPITICKVQFKNVFQVAGCNTKLLTRQLIYSRTTHR
jgi:hypothetical protein